MRNILISICLLALCLLLNDLGFAQADQICAEAGYTPSLDSPFAQVPYVYGRVVIKGQRAGAKLPRATVSVADSKDRADRLTLGESGNYCFKKRSSGGTLVVEVDGVEVSRRSLAPFGAAQQREDFEMQANDAGKSLPPSSISAKFSHPHNEQTVGLYRRAAESEKSRDLISTAGSLSGITTVDPKDFIAWAKLGTIYFEMGKYDEAEAALRRSIELKPEYTPAWINAGKLRVARKQLEAAIEVFKHAAALDPANARSFQLLGAKRIFKQNRAALALGR